MQQSNLFPTRRSFIKSLLATSAGIAAGQRKVLGQADRNFSTSRRIRIGFLGVAHSHATEKLKVAQENTAFDLIGVHEPDESVRHRFAAANVTFVSQSELLERAEAVVVESAVADHARQARLALEAGKHVHIEKPPTASLAELRALIQLAKERNRLLQVGYMWRFNPGFNVALEAARQGRLGNIYLVRATMNTVVDAAKRPEWSPFPGGAMFEQGCHLIDALVRLMGRPERVTPFLKTHGGNDTLADNCVAVFEFPRALGIITNATMQPNAFAHRFFEVLGTNGTARLQPIEPPKVQIDLAKAAGPYSAGSQSVELPPYRRYVGEFNELADAIRNGKSLSVTPEQELMVQETLVRACGSQ